MSVAKTAHFQVRADGVDAAAEAISTFVQQVRVNEPDTLFTTAFQDAEDPTRFTHTFAFRDAAAEEFRRITAWVKEFTDVLYPLTVDGVTFADHRLVATAGHA